MTDEVAPTPAPTPPPARCRWCNTPLIPALGERTTCLDCLEAILEGRHPFGDHGLA